MYYNNFFHIRPTVVKQSGAKLGGKNLGEVLP